MGGVGSVAENGNGRQMFQNMSLAHQVLDHRHEVFIQEL